MAQPNHNHHHSSLKLNQKTSNQSKKKKKKKPRYAIQRDPHSKHKPRPQQPTHEPRSRVEVKEEELGGSDKREERRVELAWVEGVDWQLKAWEFDGVGQPVGR